MRKYTTSFLSITLFVFCITFNASAATNPVEQLADYLFIHQLSSGSWGEEGFTGETTIGLARAYRLLTVEQYKTAAENAGAFILWSAEYDAASETYNRSLFAAEAYALTQLSEISDTPADNQWRTALEAYFQGIRSQSASTAAFIDSIAADYGSAYVGTAVYDIARLTAAAGYVNDPDLDIWRAGLIEHLASVPAASSCPTTALSSAIWALSTTGGLDGGTPLSGTGFLSGYTAAELPAVLADLQAPNGSFYWYFNKTDPGFVEPTALAQMALQTTGGYTDYVNRANSALTAGVESDGSVFFLLGDGASNTSFYFSGEVLEVIEEETLPLPGPIETAADRLASAQLANGTWGESGFVGETASGLARAYALIGKAAYKTAAELAGDAILWDAEYDPATGMFEYSLYASEAYALTRLSEIADDPAGNKWRTAASDYLQDIRNHVPDTQYFITTLVANYGESYIGTAVYDIARFTVTAGYVADPDLPVWRTNLIDLLAGITSDADCPTTALASAVWALAATDGLDTTILSGSGDLAGAALSQLPEILAGLQAPDGSFYWDLEKNDPGYVEPTVMAKLALETAGGYTAQIVSANQVLLNNIETDGSVYFKLGDPTSNAAFYFGAEVLEVVTEGSGAVDPLFLRGDVNADGLINIADPIFLIKYLFNNGATPTCMDAADANDDGRIDIADMITIIRYRFSDGGDLNPPFEQCGIDPTDDQLGCIAHDFCTN